MTPQEQHVPLHPGGPCNNEGHSRPLKWRGFALKWCIQHTSVCRFNSLGILQLPLIGCPIIQHCDSKLLLYFPWIHGGRHKIHRRGDMGLRPQLFQAFEPIIISGANHIPCMCQGSLQPNDLRIDLEKTKFMESTTHTPHRGAGGRKALSPVGSNSSIALPPGLDEIAKPIIAAL